MKHTAVLSMPPRSYEPLVHRRPSREWMLGTLVEGGYDRSVDCPFHSRAPGVRGLLAFSGSGGGKGERAAVAVLFALYVALASLFVVVLFAS